MSMATGIGYDCHRLVAGRPLVLGGVELEHERGLAGHSDADVLTHAIIDALLGACALGDIGEHFPDTDPRYRDADSIELLRAAVALLAEAGFDVVHVDATVDAGASQAGPGARRRSAPGWPRRSGSSWATSASRRRAARGWASSGARRGSRRSPSRRSPPPRRPCDTRRLNVAGATVNRRELGPAAVRDRRCENHAHGGSRPGLGAGRRRRADDRRGRLALPGARRLPHARGRRRRRRRWSGGRRSARIWSCST